MKRINAAFAFIALLAAALPAAAQEPVRLCGVLTVQGESIVLVARLRQADTAIRLSPAVSGVNEVFDETRAWRFSDARRRIQSAPRGTSAYGCASSDRFPFVAADGTAQFRVTDVDVIRPPAPLNNRPPED